jgi:hypothetical protein
MCAQLVGGRRRPLPPADPRSSLGARRAGDSGVGEWIEQNVGTVTAVQSLGGSSWSSAFKYETAGGDALFVKVALGKRAEEMFEGEALGLRAMHGEGWSWCAGARCARSAPLSPARAGVTGANCTPFLAFLCTGCFRYSRRFSRLACPPPAAATRTLRVPDVLHYGALPARPSGSFIVMEHLELGGRADQAELGRQLALMHLAEPSVSSRHEESRQRHSLQRPALHPPASHSLCADAHLRCHCCCAGPSRQGGRVWIRC